MATEKQQPDVPSFYTIENIRREGIFDLQCTGKSQRTKQDYSVCSSATCSIVSVPQKKKLPVVFWDLIVVGI